MTVSHLHLHRALNAHAIHILASERAGERQPNEAREFCARRLVRMAAKRRGSTPSATDAAEARAIELLAAGASTSTAASTAINELLPRGRPAQGGAA